MSLWTGRLWFLEVRTIVGELPPGAADPPAGVRCAPRAVALAVGQHAAQLLSGAANEGVQAVLGAGPVGEAQRARALVLLLVLCVPVVEGHVERHLIDEHGAVPVAAAVLPVGRVLWGEGTCDHVHQWEASPQLNMSYKHL